MTQGLSVTILRKSNSESMNINFRINLGREKKADTKMNELEDNDVRDKRERLVACVLSGNSKMYLGKEYTE